MQLGRATDDIDEAAFFVLELGSVLCQFQCTFLTGILQLLETVLLVVVLTLDLFDLVTVGCEPFVQLPELLTQ